MHVDIKHLWCSDKETSKKRKTFLNICVRVDNTWFIIFHPGQMVGKNPKILYSKVSYKMAYKHSADPDQTAPKGAVWSRASLFVIPLF